MKRILFPTDFSPAAEKAFLYALHLARDIEAEIELLYVIPEGHREMNFERLILEEVVNADAVGEVLRQFDQYQMGMQRIGNVEIPVNVRIEKGRAESEIIQLSGAFDLIVMGTQGAKSDESKVLGSVTAKVIREAHCPVLAVPEQAKYQGIHHLMYATSLLEEDLELLPFMQQFVDAFDAQISYAHVDTELTEGPVYAAVEEGYRWGEHLKMFGYYRFNYPDVVEGLNAFVKANKVDVVAMLHRSGDVFDRWFKKSFAAEMAMHTTVPLLVLQS